MKLESRAKIAAAGQFIVDNECVICNTCTSIAPFSFSLTETHCTAIVHRQPKNMVEKNLCIEAQKSCPVNAISFTTP